MSAPAENPLQSLSPKEIEYIKSQVAHMLNYTKQGTSVAVVPEEIRAKITDEMRDEVTRKIDELLKK